MKFTLFLIHDFVLLCELLTKLFSLRLLVLCLVLLCDDLLQLLTRRTR